MLADRARHFNWAKKFILFRLLLLLLMLSFLGTAILFGRVLLLFWRRNCSPLFLSFFFRFFRSGGLSFRQCVRQTSSSSSQCNWPVSNTNCRAVLLLLLLFLLSAVSELFHWKERKKALQFLPYAVEKTKNKGAQPGKGTFLSAAAAAASYK